MQLPSANVSFEDLLPCLPLSHLRCLLCLHVRFGVEWVAGDAARGMTGEGVLAGKEGYLNYHRFHFPAAPLPLNQMSIRALQGTFAPDHPEIDVVGGVNCRCMHDNSAWVAEHSVPLDHLVANRLVACHLAPLGLLVADHFSSCAPNPLNPYPKPPLPFTMSPLPRNPTLCPGPPEPSTPAPCSSLDALPFPRSTVLPQALTLRVPGTQITDGRGIRFHEPLFCLLGPSATTSSKVRGRNPGNCMQPHCAALQHHAPSMCSTYALLCVSFPPLCLLSNVSPLPPA